MAALTGNYRPEHVFALKQNLALFEYYQSMLAECDAAIERHLQTLTAQTEPPASDLPPRRTKAQPRSKEPRFDIRSYLYRLTGTDLSQIGGIGPESPPESDRNDSRRGSRGSGERKGFLSAPLLPLREIMRFVRIWADDP